jgi:hypothetical protein
LSYTKILNNVGFANDKVAEEKEGQHKHTKRYNDCGRQNGASASVPCDLQ